MHSILESDGVPSDPYEVLCHMGTLIIEGRTPQSQPESTAAGDTAAKPVKKPYTEGPHCPIFIKLHSKDSHPVHKCAENCILCIRYSNLKQHLKSLHQKSPSISVVVSLGPDCLCGELRKSSTLVSGQPTKWDVVLEQWTITIAHKRTREPSSQMSILNLYQAVRSLLHFSQLTAWYMNSNGAKPSNVIYRVCLPEDTTLASDCDFVSHDFPVADVNKNVSIKISVKTLPRMEKIPSVYCPQHPNTSETGQSSQELKEKTWLHSDQLHSKFVEENKEELMENTLPLKFQGVRKKTYESQERKRKKYITKSIPPSYLHLGTDDPVNVMTTDSDVELFLDGLPIDKKKINPDEEEECYNFKRMLQEDSLKSYYQDFPKVEFKKSKLSGLTDLTELAGFNSADTFACNYVEPALDLTSLKSFSDSKSKSEFRTKEKTSVGLALSSLETKKPETVTVMDILDDRMQISCAISGKHHCKWECEDESDLNKPGENVEKPKRRRSLSVARGSCNTFEDGKSDSEKVLHGKFKEVECCSPEDEAIPGCSRYQLESPPKPKIVDISNSSTECGTDQQTPKTECLPNISSSCKESTSEGSSRKEPSPTKKTGWVRTQTFESFKKECSFTREPSLDYSSDSDSELSDGHAETSNPFLAAILRTTRKYQTLKAKKKCDNSLKISDFWGKKSGLTGEKCKLKSETVTADESEKVVLECRKSPKTKKLDLKSKFNSWRKSEEEESSEEGQSDFLSKKFSLDLKREEKGTTYYEDLDEEIASNNLSSVKTIPVPSAHDKLKFRRSLDSAAQLVFHRCSGLPLTSSPAPVRRNNSSFSFDSTLNSVSAIKSALFEASNSLSSEDENESEGSLKSPASPGAWTVGTKLINYHSLSPLPLLGSFEESVLNGRLEPVSTVQGFTAELGASGSFCPRHMHLPVTVFFYTLGDNDKVSAPYLGHINLGKKGYNVPRSGTIQVTLFNPLRTVVKMFVVVYDLHDMPPNSHTFLRQRTLYVPTSQKESILTDKKETPFEQEDYHKYLRYLIHLRFVSGKTGRIYLHTDIRMVIFRKADEDTATALDDGETYELRSHTHGPINPKFSPRK